MESEREATLCRYKVLHNLEAILHDVDTADIVDHLYASGVITEDDLELISAEKTRKSRTRMLIEQILELHGACAFASFVEVLRQSEAYPWIVEQIEQTVVDSDNQFVRRDENEAVISAVSDILADNTVVVSNWHLLARELGFSNAQVNAIRKQCSTAEPQQLIQTLLDRFWSNLDQQANGRTVVSLDSNSNSLVSGNSGLSAEVSGRAPARVSARSKLRLLLQGLEENRFSYAAQKVRQRFGIDC